MSNANDIINKVSDLGHSVGVTVSNLEYIQKFVNSDLVRPDDITKFFGQSAVFAAEINRLLPEQYQTLVSLRQDLKVHQFDLANTLHDVELLADSIKYGIRRSERKLALR
jgi:hypothetical protein